MTSASQSITKCFLYGLFLFELSKADSGDSNAALFRDGITHETMKLLRSNDPGRRADSI